MNGFIYLLSQWILNTLECLWCVEICEFGLERGCISSCLWTGNSLKGSENKCCESVELWSYVVTMVSVLSRYKVLCMGCSCVLVWARLFSQFELFCRCFDVVCWCWLSCVEVLFWLILVFAAVKSSEVMVKISVSAVCARFV